MQLDEDGLISPDIVNKEQSATIEVTSLVKYGLFKENKFNINLQQNDLPDIESERQGITI